MLKGRYTAVVLSIVIHLVILIIISHTVVLPPTTPPPKKPAIKSYIYHPPIKEIEPQTKPAQVDKKEISEPVKAKKDTKTSEQNKENIIVEAIDVPIAKTAPSEEAPVKKANQAAKESTDKSPVTSFSALSQLRNLNKKLDEKMFEQAMSDYQQPNTGSIMHGTPIAVPHSKKQLSVEEKHKQATRVVSSDMSVRKGDDGRCFIQRDLSVVGMEGVTANESFACGKSKFDSSFQKHMKKVREKLGK